MAGCYVGEAKESPPGKTGRAFGLALSSVVLTLNERASFLEPFQVGQTNAVEGFQIEPISVPGGLDDGLEKLAEDFSVFVGEH